MHHFKRKGKKKYGKLYNISYKANIKYKRNQTDLATTYSNGFDGINM